MGILSLLQPEGRILPPEVAHTLRRMRAFLPPGYQIRALAVYMHLSFAIIYSRSIITSPSTTAASFLNIISVTFAASHVRISLRSNPSYLKSHHG